MKWARILALLVLLAAPAAALPPPVGEDGTYDVQAGDDLYTVARHHGLAMEHVAWANGLPVEFGLSRQSVVLPQRRILPEDPPEDGLVVNLPERGLYLFRGGRFRGFFPVAIGDPAPRSEGASQTRRAEGAGPTDDADGAKRTGTATPLGRYEILSREVNPKWVVPKSLQNRYEEKIVPPGPENPLGDRWIGLTFDGLGIHSTTAPHSVGGAVSNGCLRLYPPQARQLFEQVEVGMPVRIEYEPVKVGLAEDGRLFMAVFPDVYEHGDREARARRALGSGWRLASGERIGRLLETASGVAEPILGADVKVKGGAEPPVAPVLKDGRLWVPVASLGLQTAWKDGELTLRHGDRRLRVLNAPRLDGHAMVPARAVLERLDVPYRWDAGDRALVIAAD